MLPLLLVLLAGSAATAIYFLVDPVRESLQRNVFRQREHVARELEQMFIFISVDGLQALKWTGALVVAGLTLLISWEAPPPGPLIAAGLMALAAYWLPELVILVLRARRRKTFSNQLMDGLVLMANGLRSGFVLPQAIQMLVEEMPAPISQEFRLVQEEVRVGVDLDKALENCVSRTRDPDLELVVTAIKITRQLGGNLPEVFDRIVAMVRDRRVLQGKAYALTAEGRMQATVVGLLPVAFTILLVRINPEMMSLMWKTVPGFLLLLLATVLDVVGYLWVRRLSHIKY